MWRIDMIWNVDWALCPRGILVMLRTSRRVWFKMASFVDFFLCPRIQNLRIQVFKIITLNCFFDFSGSFFRRTVTTITTKDRHFKITSTLMLTSSSQKDCHENLLFHEQIRMILHPPWMNITHREVGIISSSESLTVKVFMLTFCLNLRNAEYNATMSSQQLYLFRVTTDDINR